MSRGYDQIRALAGKIAALEKKAKALGVFTHDRELRQCPRCGLMEDVVADGLLITCYPDNLGEDTGRRFSAHGKGRPRCPACEKE